MSDCVSTITDTQHLLLKVSLGETLALIHPFAVDGASANDARGP